MIKEVKFNLNEMESAIKTLIPNFIMTPDIYKLTDVKVLNQDEDGEYYIMESDLRKLLAFIRVLKKQGVFKELNNQATDKDLVIYEHDCKSKADYHLRKYRHWAQIVTSVDTTKADMTAFVGEYINQYKIRNQHKIPNGSIVVEACGINLKAYRVTGDKQKELLAEDYKSSICDFISDVAKYI